MGWPQRTLRTKYTYWAPSSSRNSFGFTNYALPIVVDGRAEHKSQMVRGTSTQEVLSDTTIFLSVATSVGGMIAEGEFAVVDPLEVPSAREIVSAHETSDIRNAAKQYQAYL
jgi:hypothetical protein